jgi:hypothetical protein
MPGGGVGRRRAPVETVLDDHGKRLDRIEKDVGALRQDVRGLRTDLPGIVASAMRDVMAKS